jgi:hypothetical protein
VGYGTKAVEEFEEWIFNLTDGLIAGAMRIHIAAVAAGLLTMFEYVR